MFIDTLGTSTIAGEESTTKTERKKTLGKDSFLTLLLAQLKYQNPLSPMESTDFSAQLAAFSSLDELFKINDNLKLLQVTKNNETRENFLDYIGKEIKSDDDSIALNNGVAFGGSYILEEMGDASITIFDEEGLEIRTIYRNDQEAGIHDVRFDGRDNNGAPVPDGMYSFTVRAFDKEGAAVGVSPGLSGRVTSVTYAAGIPYLTVGDHLVNPENIIEVSAGETL